MRTLRSRRPKRPPFPEFLIPLRRISPKITKHLQGTKFAESNYYEHLPASLPFVRDASICIFELKGMTFYVTPALYPIAQKLIEYGLTVLLGLKNSQEANWRKAVADMTPIDYDQGVVDCVVKFRPSSSDIVIRITADISRLIISVPHTCKWRLSGLRWLAP